MQDQGEFSLIKPLYIKNRDIQIDSKNKITDFELYEAVKAKVGDNITCIQLDRDLWRVYLKSTESRSEILMQGFELRHISVQVYNSNPYSTGAKEPNDEVLKMTICGLPLSVDDSAVLEMLEKYKVGLKSEIKYERIRNPVTHRMTTVLNGNRFVYTEPLPPNTSLPRIVHCAGLKCRLYHHGQETVTSQIQCFNCWEMGHRKNNCRKAKACRVCHKEGHEPGSPECEHYSTSENIVAFQGKDNPLSNFYPCEIKVFGEVHQSAEHAYQFTKAIRSGDMDAVKKIREANTALEAKRAGNTVKEPVEWETQKVTVMEEIIQAKAEQVSKFRDRLDSSNSKTTFAEATFDVYWGTGLDITGTTGTNPSKWPGENKLGFVVKKVAALVSGRRLRSVSVPRKGHHSDQDNQTNLDKFISDIRREKGKKNVKCSQSK